MREETVEEDSYALKYVLDQCKYNAQKMCEKAAEKDL